LVFVAESARVVGNAREVGDTSLERARADFGRDTSLDGAFFEAGVVRADHVEGGRTEGSLDLARQADVVGVDRVVDVELFNSQTGAELATVVPVASSRAFGQEADGVGFTDEAVVP